MCSYHSFIQTSICLPHQLSLTSSLFTHHNLQFFWHISVLFCPPSSIHQFIWLNLNSLSLCQAPIKTLPAGCSSPRCIYVILYDICWYIRPKQKRQEIAIMGISSSANQREQQINFKS